MNEFLQTQKLSLSKNPKIEIHSQRISEMKSIERKQFFPKINQKQRRLQSNEACEHNQNIKRTFNLEGMSSSKTINNKLETPLQNDDQFFNQLEETL